VRKVKTGTLLLFQFLTRQRAKRNSEETDITGPYKEQGGHSSLGKSLQGKLASYIEPKRTRGFPDKWGGKSNRTYQRGNEGVTQNVVQRKGRKSRGGGMMSWS